MSCSFECFSGQTSWHECSGLWLAADDRRLWWSWHGSNASLASSHRDRSDARIFSNLYRYPWIFVFVAFVGTKCSGSDCCPLRPSSPSTFNAVLRHMLYAFRSFLIHVRIKHVPTSRHRKSIEVHTFRIISLTCLLKDDHEGSDVAAVLDPIESMRRNSTRVSLLSSLSIPCLAAGVLSCISIWFIWIPLSMADDMVACFVQWSAHQVFLTTTSRLQPVFAFWSHSMKNLSAHLGPCPRCCERPEARRILSRLLKKEVAVHLVDTSFHVLGRLELHL